MQLRGLLLRVLLPVPLVLAACATPTLEVPEPSSAEVRAEEQKQKVVYVRALLAEQERLARIANRISVNAVDLCGAKTTYTTGAFLFDWDQTTDEWVDAANEAIGINLHSPGIEVLIVLPGSPADEAGLLVGDRVVRFGDWRVPAGRGAFGEFRDRLNARLAAGGQAVDFRVQRGTEFLTITLTPIPACDYPVLIAESNEINAYTDGIRIVVFRGLLRFVRDDDELAMIIAHELAHIVLSHIDARRQNAAAGAAVGAVVDVLIAATTGIYTSMGQGIGAGIGAEAFSKEFEAEADYLSAYMLAQADYDYTRLPDLHRHRGTLKPRTDDYNRTHPTSSQRTVYLQKVVEEIRKKQIRDAPLVPNSKAPAL